MSHTYLDYNATAPLFPEVLEAMYANAVNPYNASSVHSFGREARQLIEGARRKILSMAGAEGYDLIFTSGGTEANNLALNALDEKVTHIISSTEHISVQKNAVNPHIIPVDSNGVIELDALEKILLSEGKALVSVMLANNETGVIQPIKEVAQLVYSHGGYMHCDASQAFGKISVNTEDLNVDMMTVSAHKFGGPQGVGALIFKKGLNISSLQKGGGQERGHRAGTENVQAIIGFGVAAEKAKTLGSELRDGMECKIKAIAPDVVIFGENATRLPNTSYISMPNVTGEMQLITFDIDGFAVSSGAACSSGKVELSHVLQAMGVAEEMAINAIRVSIGKKTTEEEINSFVEAWAKLYKRFANRKPDLKVA